MSLALLRPFHTREIVQNPEIVNTIHYSEGVKNLLRNMLRIASSPRADVWFVNGMAQALRSSVEDPLIEMFAATLWTCALCGDFVRDNGMGRSLPCCGNGWVCSEVCRMVYGKEGARCRHCGTVHKWT
jgi:hypothetical protein